MRKRWKNTFIFNTDDVYRFVKEKQNKIAETVEFYLYTL